MQVWITIDRMDGGTTVKGPFHPDEISLTGLLFKLNESGVAGVTFTRANPLNALRPQVPAPTGP
jgi:hypothetical protein